MTIRVSCDVCLWLVMCFFFEGFGDHRDLHVLTHSFPTRRSSDLLVGDVIVFRQQLSRNVERDAVRAVCGNGLRKARGNLRQRIVPTRTLPELRTTFGVAALRMEQACLRPQGFGQRAALHAQTAGIGRVRSEEHTSELQSLMRITYAV